MGNIVVPNRHIEDERLMKFNRCRRIDDHGQAKIRWMKFWQDDTSDSKLIFRWLGISPTDRWVRPRGFSMRTNLFQEISRWPGLGSGESSTTDSILSPTVASKANWSPGSHTTESQENVNIGILHTPKFLICSSGKDECSSETLPVFYRDIRVTKKKREISYRPGQFHFCNLKVAIGGALDNQPYSRFARTELRLFQVYEIGECWESLSRLWICDKNVIMNRFLCLHGDSL